MLFDLAGESPQSQKRRYEEKKEAYLSVIGGGSGALIHRVFWVGYNDRIFEMLKDVAGREPKFFIETYLHFQAKL